MKTYDPLGGVVYVHMVRRKDPYAIPATSSVRETRLPAGYANRSLRTCLRRWTRGSPGIQQLIRQIDVGVPGPDGPESGRRHGE